MSTNDDDEALRARMLDALPGSEVPPPELYDQLIANGSWPLALSKEQVAEYWATRRKAMTFAEAHDALATFRGQ